MLAADSSPAPKKNRQKDGRAPKKSKQTIKVKKTKIGISVSVRFVAPTDSQLSEIARVLNQFLDT